MSVALRALPAALLISLVAPAPGASAVPGSPRNLEVEGGERWHADPGFELTWTNPPPGGTALAAARYLVRDDAGAVVVGPKRTEIPVERVGVAVPPREPGAYTFEAWLEDATGAQGPPATTRLRFDDTRPADVEPLPHAGWIGRAELPFALRLGHPAGGHPPAGIRGYAVTVDRDPDGEPCAGAERCSDDEADLRGGAGDDTLAVDLPEGLSYVHAVAVSGSGMRSAASSSTPLRVDRTDPVTRIAGLPEGWANRPVVLRASASDGASGMRPDGQDGPFTAIGIDDGPPAVSAGAAVSATVIGSGVHTVAYYARDAAGNVADGAAANGRRNAAPALAQVRIDPDPPTVSFLPSTHPDDPELIEARVSDPLSGPAPGRGSIGIRAAGSRARFEPLPTSADDGLLQARWNSDDYPSGEYEFEASGYDRAGNPAAGTRRIGGSPMVLPSPLKTPTELSARLGGRETQAGTSLIPYGRGVTYRGRLALASGSPLAGASLRVVERFGPGAGAAVRVTSVGTSPDGRFALWLAPGPSREVLALFAGTRTRARSSSTPLRLAVRSGLRLHASAAAVAVGGRPVVFRGGVVGGEVPAGGLSVQLQFRLPGLPWTEFRTVQTDRRGRFRYAYRFTDDDSRGVRFLFRAYLPAQGEWPYEPGGSLPVAVRGY